MAKKRVKIDHFLIFFAQFFLVELFCDVLHHERPHFDWHIRIGDLGYENQPTLNSGKYFWKRVLFCESQLKLRRFSSGKKILDSGNKYTTHNQHFHWDVLRRWWPNLSLSLSLFIPIFRVLPVSLRDCLYCEKDVDGGLCHGHISHLVHPKICILDRLQHAKKGPKYLANTFSNAIAILQKKIVGWRRQIFFCTWQIPLAVTNSTWQTNQLDKFTWQVHSSLCPLTPLQITWQVQTCQVDLFSQLVQFSYHAGVGLVTLCSPGGDLFLRVLDWDPPKESPRGGGRVWELSWE